MLRTFAVVALLLPLTIASASAQRSIEAQPLPPLGPEAPQAPPAPGAGSPIGLGSPSPSPYAPPAPSPSFAAPPVDTASPAQPATAETSQPGRVFCDQAVTFRLSDPDSVPERFRSFVGIFSDAAWTPLLCAALIVENVQPDGTASIVYAFGPMGSRAPLKGGVLHGTGVIRDGELRFQNSDGSQYAFRPLYSDLDGHYTTPQGQGYQAIFKKSF